jgi:hypothetical protein
MSSSSPSPNFTATEQAVRLLYELHCRAFADGKEHQALIAALWITRISVAAGRAVERKENTDATQRRSKAVSPGCA